MSGRIYSVGYEGLTVDALVDRLVGSKVTTLVDARLNPSSRRPGWSLKSRTASLDGAGITYVREKLLGNRPENRDSFRKGDGEEGRSAMRALFTNSSAPAPDAVRCSDPATPTPHRPHVLVRGDRGERRDEVKNP